jgi:hypothetical protein
MRKSLSKVKTYIRRVLGNDFEIYLILLALGLLLMSFGRLHSLPLQPSLQSFVIIGFTLILYGFYVDKK